MSVSIIADSTCDLSPELIKQYNIDIIPLHVHLGAEEYLDGVNISPDKIFQWSDAYKTTPKTSAFSPYEAETILNRHLEQGDEVIVFCISSEMSASYNVVRMIAEESEYSDRIFVVDSENLSTGIGLQVLDAAIMAQKGYSASDIFDKILTNRDKVKASFIVDTLTYLHRGGRCSGLAALAGGALKLHPYIAVEHGKMHAGKKYRGKMDKVLTDYFNDLKPLLLTADKSRVFITHSNCDEQLVNNVRNTLSELNYFDEILETHAGSVVSSHCGPGTLGILFISQ
jgi:DegV family protein with EDD domain